VETPLESLLALLDLEELEVNLFRGRSPKEDSQRVFGGQVLGQALVAAGRTVEERIAHSFHAYFLRPGDPRVPILYQVDRTRDGRSFTTRRVIAIQHGRAIFHMEASFHRVERGPEHQVAMPTAPDPETLPETRERLAPLAERLAPGVADWLTRDRAIDIRHATAVDPVAPGPLPPRLDVWIRVDGVLPEDPRHGMDAINSGYQIASLDHAMWFHRPFRADDWLLYSMESPSAGGARGFASGRLYARDASLVVSVVQEGLIRPATPG
jgi:acyl-CoA thioesterase-2